MPATERPETQGIHFWATAYFVIVLAGSLWHVIRVRRWRHTTGQLRHLGIRRLGGTDIHPADQDYVPDALYDYQVNGKPYQGREISVWKMSASGVLTGSAMLLAKRVRATSDGTVDVYYHPGKPHKSLLLRPGTTTLLVLVGLIVLTMGIYVWRWGI